MTDDRALRHRSRMARRKARVDAAIAAADQDRGLLLVLTGPGKGKSSSAFGMVARALGHGLAVQVVQFIKGRSDTGEEAFFRRQPGVAWQVCGEGFTWETQDLRRDIATARAGWEKAKQALADPAVSLVVLDELTYLINYRYLSLDEVLPPIRNRPDMQHVVITGRAAHADLVDLADTVSAIRDEKHAFRAGVRAQVGIDL